MGFAKSFGSLLAIIGYCVVVDVLCITAFGFGFGAVNITASGLFLAVVLPPIAMMVAMKSGRPWLTQIAYGFPWFAFGILAFIYLH